MWWHWKSYTIHGAFWHVRDAWREVTQSCILGAWKKLCLHLTVDFWGFNLFEVLSKECLKCLELARKVGLSKIEEDNLESLLESISEELTTEDLKHLEKQQSQLEEEVEAGKQPTVPQTKEMTIDNSPGVPQASPPDHGLHG